MTAIQDSEILDAYTVVFDGLTHLGPGNTKTTKGILDRLCSSLPPRPRVADLGCGVGASALVLVQNLPEAQVLAVDAHEPFIARLKATAAAQGLTDRIYAMTADMANPPELDGSQGRFDLIWSESAIYNIGRTNAFSSWRPLLRTGGWLVFSDIVWQREPSKRSNEASTFWSEEYPDITTTDSVVTELRAAGFNPLGPVLSSREAWSDYYEPLRHRLRLLANQPDRSQALVEILEGFVQEIAVYDSFGDDVGLCFFVASPDFMRAD